MKRFAIVMVAVLAAVAACKKKDKPVPAAGRDAAAAVVADAAVAAIDAAPAPDAPATDGGLAARKDGVGPLDARTEVSQQALSAALPGYQVKLYSQSQGGDLKEEYWAISKGDTVLLHVQFAGTSLNAIDIVSDQVANPFGIKLGMSHADVTQAVGAMDCSNAGDEVDWRSDVVVCGNAKLDSYTLDFQADNGLGAAELLEDPAALGKATLRAITFQAVTIGPPGR